MSVFKVGFVFHGELAEEALRLLGATSKTAETMRALAVVVFNADHSFRPDFDIACTHPGCGLGQEEHR